MENLNTSLESTGAGSQVPLTSRVARHLVCQQLSLLKDGSLTIREAGQPTMSFGDGDMHHEPAELIIHDSSTWKDLLTGGSVGAAESYVAGDWSTPDLVALLRFFTRN
ncbi:MAG: SAM-dependent methyltransferase, partial [Marinobacter sp.]|nr:SAM-dependent methyltransferase [Marinobacter sp.]